MKTKSIYLKYTEYNRSLLQKIYDSVNIINTRLIIVKIKNFSGDIKNERKNNPFIITTLTSNQPLPPPYPINNLNKVKILAKKINIKIGANPAKINAKNNNNNIKINKIPTN